METLTAIQKQYLEQPKERISGSEAIVRCLLAEGVDVLYGYPGGAIMPVYDELYKYEDKINHVLTRHEQCALMPLKVMRVFLVRLGSPWPPPDPALQI